MFTNCSGQYLSGKKLTLSILQNKTQRLVPGIGNAMLRIMVSNCVFFLSGSLMLVDSDQVSLTLNFFFSVIVNKLERLPQRSLSSIVRNVWVRPRSISLEEHLKDWLVNIIQG